MKANKTTQREPSRAKDEPALERVDDESGTVQTQPWLLVRPNGTSTLYPSKNQALQAANGHPEWLLVEIDAHTPVSDLLNIATGPLEVPA